MSWNNIIEKHQKKYDRKLIACEDDEERIFIADSLMEEFPLLDREKVEEVIDRCCQTMPPPRHTDIFLGVVAALVK
jgi:predicted O-methyltransferase YrrM